MTLDTPEDVAAQLRSLAGMLYPQSTEAWAAEAIDGLEALARKLEFRGATESRRPIKSNPDAPGGAEP